MLAVKDRSNVVRAVCDRYADRFGVDLQGPACMAEIYGHEFADWAHAEDELALRLGLSVSLTPSTSGPVKTLRAPLDGDLLQVRVTDAAEDLDALLAIRWPELGDEARRVLWAVTGWASPSGVAQVGDLEQLAARAGIAEPRTARLLLELAQRGALGLSGGEAEALWLPPLLRGEVLSEPQERLAGVQRGLEALTAAVEGLASGGMVKPVSPTPPKKRWRVVPKAPAAKDGRYWQVRIYDPETGKRRQQSARPATTREEAEAFARAREAELNGDAFGLAAVMSRHVAWLKETGAKPNTIASARTALARAGSRITTEPTREALSAARDALLADGLAAKTANNYLQWCSLSWAWGLERGLCEGEWPRLKKLKETPTELRPCSPGETYALLAYFDSRPKRWAWEGPYFALVAAAGSRVTETMRLRQEDLDRERSVVTFRADRTKTSRARSVPIPPDVMARLPKRPGELWPKLRYWHVSRAWHRALGELGLSGEKIRPHSLRRAWICDAFEARLPLNHIMATVGHTDAKTTLGYERLATTRDLEGSSRRLVEFRKSAAGPPPKPLTGGGGPGVRSREDEGPEVRESSGCCSTLGASLGPESRSVVVLAAISRIRQHPNQTSGCARALRATFGGARVSP